MIKYILLFYALSFGVIAESIIPEIEKASELYSLEREAIKNYTSLQEIETKIQDKYSVTIIEKKEQAILFFHPNLYIFQTLHHEINGISQVLEIANSETIPKKKDSWLHKENLKYYHFHLVEETEDTLKFTVSPTKKQGIYKGELWIFKGTFKIKKIKQSYFKNPAGIKFFEMEMLFDKEFEYQEPSTVIIRTGKKLRKQEYDILLKIESKEFRFNESIRPW